MDVASWSLHGNLDGEVAWQSMSRSPLVHLQTLQRRVNAVMIGGAFREAVRVLEIADMISEEDTILGS